MKKKVLITLDLPKEACQLLKRRFQVTWNKRQLTPEQLVRRARPYHALLTTLADKVTEKVFQAAPHLRVVGNFAVGFNNVDLEAARKHHVIVTNTPDVLTDATADLTWALILSCARRLPEGERMVRSGRFLGAHPLMLLGLDLKGKTLGLFGCGRIGQAVARRGRGWEMPVIYYNRHRLPSATERSLNARLVTFDRLLRESDFLCVTAPLNAQTRGRFTLREFRKMKRTATFINTGRGPIHREKDLAVALQKGLIFYAGLDVYENEPKIDPVLCRSKRVSLSPHIGSATIETRIRMALLAAKNIERVLTGRKALTPVT